MTTGRFDFKRGIIRTIKLMRVRRKIIRKSSDLLKRLDFAWVEAGFALGIIKSNPATLERLAVAESKALLAHDAISAKLLDSYRSKAKI